MDRTRIRTRPPDPPVWTGLTPPENFTLRLTFAECSGHPQPVHALRKTPELVHAQEFAAVELEQWALPSSYRLVCWLPATADLRVDSVIRLDGVEWVIRAITPRGDRYRLSPGPAGSPAGSQILRLAEMPGA